MKPLWHKSDHTNPEASISVVYIGQSQAKPDKVEDLRNFLTSIVLPAVRASEGCESCQMFQSQDEPTKFVVIEIWASLEAHRASVKNIPAESIGEYYEARSGPTQWRLLPHDVSSTSFQTSFQ